MNLAKYALAALALVPLACSSEPAGPAGIDKNKQYLQVAQQETEVADGQVEVAEVFWYGCGHCFQAEPFVQKWKKNAPKNAKLIRIPAPLNKDWEVHARAFYTAELLGIGEQIHQPMFNEIHLNRNKLHNRSRLRDFFGKQGISASKFDAAFDSFAVTTRLNRAKVLVEGYKIRSVPTFIVDGQYIVTSRHHKSFDDMMGTITKLAEHELAKKTTAAK